MIAQFVVGCVYATVFHIAEKLQVKLVMLPVIGSYI